MEVSIGLVSVTVGSVVSEMYDTVIVPNSSSVDVAFGDDFLGMFRGGGL